MFIVPKGSFPVTEIPTIPDALFIACRDKYSDRILNNDLSPDVNIKNDYHIVKFKKSDFTYLFSGGYDAKDHIVFKFICNSIDERYSELNVTPVIMGKNTNAVKKYSRRGGNNLDLGQDDSESTLHIKNYEKRKEILKNHKEFKNDSLGIAYTIEDFLDTFKNGLDITIHFMIGNFIDFYVPRVSIALVHTADFEKYQTLDDFLRNSDMRNHGAECCPIT